MNSLLLSAVVLFSGLAQDSAQPGKDAKDGKMTMQKIEGDWEAVYVEMDGKKVENKKFTKVTIKNNVVTCQHDGSEKSWKLSFGPHHMVRATEQTGTTGSGDTGATDGKKGSHTHFGTYIASQEYFCLCMNKGMDKRVGERQEGKEGNQREGKEGPPRGAFGTFEGHPNGAGMVIILRRAGTATEKTP